MKAFWRKIAGYRQPADVLTIDIMGDDIEDLSMYLVSLPDAALRALRWSRDDRNRVFEAVNAHAMSRYKTRGDVDPENRLQPVTLPRADWRKLYRAVMAARKMSGAGKWPGRVALRLMAEGLSEGL